MFRPVAKLAFFTIIYAAAGYIVGTALFHPPFGMPGNALLTIAIWTCMALGVVFGFVRGCPLPSQEQRFLSLARRSGLFLRRWTAPSPGCKT